MILTLVLSLAIPTNAILLEPEEYRDYQCELIAKEYQNTYGGHIIFIQPLKPNGAYDLGQYNGHFVNRAWNKERGVYYIDWQSQTYFNNTGEIKDWYYNAMGKKSEIYDINGEGVPFPMVWHY